MELIYCRVTVLFVVHSLPISLSLGLYLSLSFTHPNKPSLILFTHGGRVSNGVLAVSHFLPSRIKSGSGGLLLAGGNGVETAQNSFPQTSKIPLTRVLFSLVVLLFVIASEWEKLSVSSLNYNFKLGAIIGKTETAFQGSTGGSYVERGSAYGRCERSIFKFPSAVGERRAEIAIGKAVL